MAKAKSKKLTIEDALVPVEEQPYEVPENWCWTTLDQVCFFENGYAFKSDKFSDNGIPVIRISNIFDNEVSIEGCVYTTEENIDDRFIIKNGDLLIAMSGATTGKNGVFLSYQKAYLNQRVGNIKVINHNVLLEGFRNYYIASKQEEILRNAYGGAQPNISSTKIGKMLFPLPPLPEQKRIVEQIESLFSKLDEAKERIQTTIDNSEDRKNAIFSKAFSGELTSEWREQQKVSLDTWKDVISQDVCEPITCGKTPKEYISPEGEIPYLKVYNIVENKIDFVTTPQFIPREIHEGKLKSSRLKPHDVVMNIVGPPLRKVAIIPDDHADWNMNQAIVRFRPYPELMNYKYLYYALLNPETLDDVIAQTRGVVGQANISVTQSRNLRLKCPTIIEQKEVVRILEGLLEREDEIVKLSINVIDEITTLKKSILAKAFRGELGTNNDEEDSAELFLKKIISK